jgi:uncharacterized membrane protein YphA (DoxX/SURF4 family)
VVGAFLVSFGYPMLFTAGGHANIVHLLTEFGVPWAGTLGWVVGVIQFGGGVLLLLGLWVRLAAALAAFSVGGHLFLALLQGGFPEPLPGQAPLPGFELSTFLVFSLLALVIGGAGRLSIDGCLAYRRWRRQKPLTLVAPVRAGEEEALARILAEIDADLLGNPYIHFGEDRISHFARFLFATDPDQGLQLVFASTYNGSLEEYAAELVRVSPGLDDIWGRCEGYPGREGFYRFVRRAARRNRAVFMGFPRASVAGIRRNNALRGEIESFLDLPQVAAYLRFPGVGPFLRLLERLAVPPPLLVRIERWLRDAVRAVLSFAQLVFRTVGVQVAYWIVQWITDATFSKTQSVCGDVAGQRAYFEQLNRLEATENRFVQNSFTVFAPVVPGWKRLRLRLAMLLGAPLVRYGWPEGDFAGVFTLHNFRWLLLDRGRYLMFMSDFDFSAENYLGDFLAQLDWGLDLFYSSCEGYPPAGMKNVGPFVRWIRDHQLVTRVYYCAYPRTTVLHILTNQQIAETIGRPYDPQAARAWMNTL